MKKTIIFLFIVGILLLVFGIIPGINDAKTLQRIESGYIEQAKSILSRNNLKDEPSLVADKKCYESICLTNVKINIQSDSFESMDQSWKIIILDEICQIPDVKESAKIQYKISNTTIESQGIEYYISCYENNIYRNNEPFPPSLSSTSNSSAKIVGSWFDSYDSSCHDIVIKKFGTSYQMTTTCDDGSSDTTSLTAKVVSGEERLYGNGNSAVGDYMVIESNGNLAFYDNQGLIYEATPK